MHMASRAVPLCDSFCAYPPPPSQPCTPSPLHPLQEVGDESQLAAVLDVYPVYRGIWAVHQNEAFGDKVGGGDAAAAYVCTCVPHTRRLGAISPNVRRVAPVCAGNGS